jgi:hypothetical protein
MINTSGYYIDVKREDKFDALTSGEIPERQAVAELLSTMSEHQKALLYTACKPLWDTSNRKFSSEKMNKRLRELGLSYSDLAQILKNRYNFECSVSGLTAYHTRGVVPSTDVFLKIAAALECPVLHLTEPADVVSTSTKPD